MFRNSPKGGPISTQQTAIASTRPANSAWYETFKPAASTPPRGFSFAAVAVGKTILLIYSVHLKSNRGGIAEAIPKREESAVQLVSHAMAMEKLYGRRGPVVTIIAGDFNTDPTDPQFSGEKTFEIFERAGFQWTWKGITPEKRVTHKGKGRYPDATFDGFLTKGAAVATTQVLPAMSASDHNPVALKITVP